MADSKTLNSLTLDGSFSLSELQNTLNTQEQLGFQTLRDIAAASDERADSAGAQPINVASFEPDLAPAGPNPLVLVALKPNDDVKALPQSRQGKFLFEKQTYVSGAIQRVAFFRTA